MSYDNWKLSTPEDTVGDSGLVTACCGSDEYKEDVEYCGACGSFNIEALSSGTEFWMVCGECRSVEQDERADCVCEKCEKECDLIPIYEYVQNGRDDEADMMRDER